MQYARKNDQSRHVRLGVIILFIALIICAPQCVAEDEPNHVILGSALIGALWGAGDSVINQRDLFKSTWDGALTGASVPGAVVGLTLGTSLGVAVNVAIGQPINEKGLVGWASAGVLMGTILTHATLINGVENASGRSLALAVDAAYLGLATYTASVTAKERQRITTSDAILHRQTMATVRRYFDPGTALTIGFAKEASDYFLGTGHPEIRDLKNDWEGTFNGINTY